MNTIISIIILMPINQLFIKKPERELVEKLINTYGLTSFEDETVFSKRKFEKNARGHFVTCSLAAGETALLEGAN